MREIKFRAWSIEKIRFIDIFDINCFGDVLSVGYSDLGEPGKDITNNVILNQYIGLKDKNGKEIYEGDIYHHGDMEILYVVEWHDTGFMGRQIGTRGSRVGLEYWKINIEIIGNIYENPELIKNHE